MNEKYYFEFTLPGFAEITTNGNRMLLERQVKQNGIWRIHKSDADDIFPSDPHGDRVDGPEKLNLYTGEVFSKSTKHFLYTMPSKAMKFIYNELLRCKEQNIIDKLNANKGQITYL